MEKNDNNVIEFKLPEAPRRNKVKELRMLLKEKERRKLEREKMTALQKQWSPEISWSTILLATLSFGTLFSVILLSVYAALK